MLKTGLIVCLSCLLTACCWLSSIQPAIATPGSLIAIETTLGGTFTLFKFSGKRPTNLGVNEGKLALCPASPNCVSSQTPDTDPAHKVDPIAYRSSAAQAMANLKSVLQSMERTTIITETENYLYAEFASALMGFVDDVEFYLEPGTNLIQMRSASRLGQSDLGVNRQRMESIRSKFAEMDQM